MVHTLRLQLLIVETQHNFDAIQLAETITRDRFLYAQQELGQRLTLCVGDIIWSRRGGGWCVLYIEGASNVCLRRTVCEAYRLSFVCFSFPFLSYLYHSASPFDF